MKKFELKPLPYDYAALEPVISQKILKLHHDKHHAAYVAGANAALENLEKARQSNAPVGDMLRKLSFNLNGHLLHELFWESMCPPIENNAPKGKIKAAIDKNFGSYENFKKQFSDAAISVEGSGWAVLSKDNEGNLFLSQIEKHNMMHIVGFTPILVLDVWEHAYYPDYENRRVEFVGKFWSIVNWEGVGRRL